MLLNLLFASAISFTSPVNYEISLAGNFGEPRPNHFHGGIDIKTGGVEGKPIMSVGDGYVARVTVGLYGYGNALFIRHPEGYTSVYCHLKKFTPQIAAVVRRYQYRNKSAKIDIKLKPTDCPVAKGQLIAISGNTGASQAPHLHLEIHDTQTGNMMDPLDFLSAYVHDDMKPIAHGFMAYPQEGEGVFCGGTNKQTYGFLSLNLTRKFTAWGKVGFGIWANDYMEITYNRYGIRDTKLTVDGHVVFHSNVNNIPVKCNRMVNSWGDYEHFRRYNVWYMKSFVEPGNTLPVLQTDKNKGIVDFNQERDYHLVYTVTDFAGNSRDYSFTVTGKKYDLPHKKTIDMMTFIPWNRTTSFSRPGVQLMFSPKLLANNVSLQPTIRRHPNALSDSYSFYSTSCPLFSWATLAIRCNKKVAEPSKLYIAGYSGIERFYGGSYKNGWVYGRIRELGAKYQIAYDDTPPVINPLGQGAWNQTHIIKLGLSDTKSGVKHYEGYVDGHFVLFEEIPKSPWVACNLKETPLHRTGRIRTVKFIVTDNRNNKRVFSAQIKY